MKIRVLHFLKLKLILILSLAFSMIIGLLAVSCKAPKTFKYFTPEQTTFGAYGRTDILDRGAIGLIGPASCVRMNIVGDSASVRLNSSSDYDYVTLIADDEHLGRFKVDATTNFTLPVKFEKSSAKSHTLSVYKATEANAGTILFKGVYSDSVWYEKPVQGRKKIEFIGNSITCGAAMDDSLLPCGAGDYKNYHNAYLSYGPTVARALNTDFLLSSVSGFGIYRGWNTAPKEEINTVPEVYSNVYLDGDGKKDRDFTSYIPDLISICLGTNDLSKGDGEKRREAFDPEQFISRYIAFVEKIHAYYPNSQIALLNSPMVSGKENDLLVDCLMRIKIHFDEASDKSFITLFSYARTYQNGCTTHPNIKDHKRMAAELYPFYRKLLGK